jgi:plastocyanin
MPWRMIARGLSQSRFQPDRSRRHRNEHLDAGATTGTKAATATVTNATGSPVAFTALAGTAGPAGGGGVTIELGPDGGNRFEPSSVMVLASTTVTWYWPTGSLAHNVTPDDGVVPAGSGALTDGEHIHTYTFTAPGIHRFHCAKSQRAERRRHVGHSDRRLCGGLSRRRLSGGKL